MKKMYLLFLSFVAIGICNAVPLTGTKNIPGDYATLALAITDLNLQGVGAGGVTLNLVAGNPQTAPAGGYIIGGAGSLVLTTTSAGNQVTIQGNSNVITASGALTVGATNDGIFKLIGADYVTISGFTMLENGSNTVTSPAGSNNMTEFGVALYYVTITDGAQHDTIRNNTITLNNGYRNTFGIYSNTRHSSTSLTAVDASSATGANSFNGFYSNTISNINYGIVVVGSTTNATMGDGNDIGGLASTSGNIITNYGSVGGGQLSTYPGNTGSNYAIFSNHQINDNISYNSISTAGLTALATAGGINKDYTSTPPTGLTFTTNITNNIVTIVNNPIAATATTNAIINQGFSTLISGITVNLNNNIIQNSIIGGSNITTGSFNGVQNASAVGLVNMNGNKFINNSIASTSTTTGAIRAIYNIAAATTVNMNNDTITGISITANTATTAGISGVRNAGAVTTLNMNDNVIRGLSNTSPVTTGTLVGIINTGAVTGVINVNNNQLGNSAGDFASITNASLTAVIEGIEIGGAAASSTVFIDVNSVRGINAVYLGKALGIFIPASFLGSAINITNNSLGTVGGNFITFSGVVPSNSVISGILTTGGSASGSLTVTGNDFRGFVNTVTGAATHTYIDNDFGTLTQNISNNTFTDLTANTTGAVVFIDNNITLPAGGSSTVNNNRIVTAFNKSAAGSYVRFYADFGSSPAGTTQQNNTNNFSNITVTGATKIDGWMNYDGALGVAGTVKTISNNTFTNITGGSDTVQIINVNRATNNVSNNLITNVTGADNINGIILNQDIFLSNVNANNIHTMSTTGAVNISGININGVVTTTNNVFGNKIYDLTLNNAAAGGVNGLFVISGASNTMYNNLIGDLKAPAFSGVPDPVRGINIISTMVNSTNTVKHNTIYLTASSSGTDFGSTALYHTASATATTSNLILQNNIIINNSTGKGTGYSVAFKRSGPSLANYDVSSNNNNFYVTPSINSLIYFDQVNFIQTLAAFKVLVAPRESASITENTTFVSTNGASNGYLHLTPGSANIDAGLNAGIATDYDLDARPQGAGYDIGADELVVLVPVAIEYFRGSKLAGANYLDWKVNCTGEPSLTLILERSSDGRNFTAIQNQNATATRCLQGFNYTDASPLSGINYYRLKTVTPNGAVRYSVIVALINKDKGFELISVSPNPVKANAVLSISTVKGGRMDVSVTDITGKVVMKQSLTVIAGNNPVNMNFAPLGAGSYNITVINAENEIKSTRFVKY